LNEGAVSCPVHGAQLARFSRSIGEDEVKRGKIILSHLARPASRLMSMPRRCAATLAAKIRGRPDVIVGRAAQSISSASRGRLLRGHFAQPALRRRTSANIAETRPKNFY